MKWKSLYILIITILFGGFPLQKLLASDSSKVYVFEINEEIAEPVWHNLKNAFSEAKQLNSTHFIINMNTYGGAVVMADSIRTALLRMDIPVYMLINNNAASAGALISIACDKIFMTPGSTIGAATVVTQDGAPAIDKYQSYFRSKMRATAEVTGRDPDIAEAMVDQDIAIAGITEKGKLLTFTVTEAIQNNYCEKEVENLDGLLKETNLSNAVVVHYVPTKVDAIIGWLINPAISGVLIMIMLGGIYFELQSPGIGFPIAASAMSAILFFAPLYIQGLAENWEIILFAIGVLLLAAEILVIPGTGITGVIGVLFILISLTLAMVENIRLDFTMVRMDGLLLSFSIVLMAILVMSIITIVMMPKMLESGYLKRLVLNKSQKISDGYVGIDTTIQTQIGRSGIVVSDLRPAGKIDIENTYYDASSEGNYISKGEKVKVIGSEGPQLIVTLIN
tara:strand:+ start:66058 stop:67410 length:1353 start_codon:yes stop_codon:yes gene_type:complete